MLQSWLPEALSHSLIIERISHFFLPIYLMYICIVFTLYIYALQSNLLVKIKNSN